MEVNPTEERTATFGGGCFWCVEAVFERLRGVEAVEPGYEGGHVENPTYEQVCTGTTGHAEVCLVRYDPSKVAYRELLEVFFKTHDPTTRDRQGDDVGPQYRSVIFFHDDEQRRLAEEYLREIDASGIFEAPLVTAIEPARRFFPAEDYHRRYYDENANQPYCRMVIRPKVEKLTRLFAKRLKERGREEGGAKK